MAKRVNRCVVCGKKGSPYLVCDKCKLSMPHGKGKGRCAQ